MEVEARTPQAVPEAHRPRTPRAMPRQTLRRTPATMPRRTLHATPHRPTPRPTPRPDATSADAAADAAPDAAPACPTGPVEFCNGADDDCDGLTDEDLLRACFTAGDLLRRRRLPRRHLGCAGGEFGACDAATVRRATRSATASTTTATARSTRARYRACYGGPPAPPAWAPAPPATRTCADGVFGACAGQVLPALEICDGIDDDCDGDADEGLDCVCLPGTDQPCYAGPPGPPAWALCRTGTQTCRADGATSDRVTARCCPTSRAATASTRTATGGRRRRRRRRRCLHGRRRRVHRARLTVCDPGDAGLRCGALPGEPGDETCDQTDDDCDGATDEASTWASLRRRRRRLRGPGRARLRPGGRRRLLGEPGAPRPEVCNASTTTATARTDEGLGLGAPARWAGGACLARASACAARRTATWCCDAVARRAGRRGLQRRRRRLRRPADRRGRPVRRVLLGGPAGRGDVGRCLTGLPDLRRRRVRRLRRRGAPGRRDLQRNRRRLRRRRRRGPWPRLLHRPRGHRRGRPVRRRRRPAPPACSATAPARACPPETCNAATTTATACRRGRLPACYERPGRTDGVGACAAAARTLRGGVFGACDGDVAPGRETCDGLDDDCDGATDETTTRACYGGPAGTAGVGLSCAAPSLRDRRLRGVCAGEVRPAAEACDAEDDDCDGATDEDIPQVCYEGPGGTAGVGRCRAGAAECVVGVHGGLRGRGAAHAEACNAIDDDCDGAATTPSCRLATPARGHRAAGALPGGPAACGAALRRLRQDQVRAAGRGCDGVDDDCDGAPTRASSASATTGPRAPWGVGPLRRGPSASASAGASARLQRRVPPPPSSATGSTTTATAPPTMASTSVSLHLPAAGAAPATRAHLRRARHALQRGAGAAGAEVCNGVDDDCDGVGRRPGVQPQGLRRRHPRLRPARRRAREVLGRHAPGPDRLRQHQRPRRQRERDGREHALRRSGAGRVGIRIAMGAYHQCALFDSGRMKCWGYNVSGQLGIGDVANRGDAVGEMGDTLPLIDLGAGRTVTAMATGQVHTCALLDNGSVKCWGGNAFGQLGLGDVVARGDNARTRWARRCRR